jgi:hypothetical protein
MLQLRYCSIEWTEAGARTVFPDGAETTAWPHPEQPHYHVISHRCGYGDDVLAYAREHELAHALVGEEILREPSHVLDSLAHGVTPDRGLAVVEEMAVATLLRWVRANERPIIADWDWDALKAVFLGHAAQLNEAMHKERLQ